MLHIELHAERKHSEALFAALQSSRISDNKKIVPPESLPSPFGEGLREDAAPMPLIIKSTHKHRRFIGIFGKITSS